MCRYIYVCVRVWVSNGGRTVAGLDGTGFWKMKFLRGGRFNGNCRLKRHDKAFPIDNRTIELASMYSRRGLSYFSTILYCQ